MWTAGALGSSWHTPLGRASSVPCHRTFPNLVEYCAYVKSRYGMSTVGEPSAADADPFSDAFHIHMTPPTRSVEKIGGFCIAQSAGILVCVCEGAGHSGHRFEWPEYTRLHVLFPIVEPVSVLRLIRIGETYAIKCIRQVHAPRRRRTERRKAGAEGTHNPHERTDKTNKTKQTTKQTRSVRCMFRVESRK